MRVSKRFRWEGAHRLPWHGGPCRHLHGHSYELWVELDGEPDARGLLIDFQDVKRVLKPLIDAWDHAVLVAETDAALRAALDDLGTRYTLLPYDTTSENLCRYATDYLLREGGALLHEHGVTAVRVRVQETATCYAELETRLGVEMELSEPSPNVQRLTS